MTQANAEMRQNGTLRAVIIRADGSHEDQGVVSASYSNPVRQWWWEQVGRRLAARRARRANRNAMRLRGVQEGR